MKTTVARIRNFFYQSQEFTLWLPGLVLLAVLGYVVLGGLARVGTDAIAWLLELPAWSAWAAAWLGTAWLIQYLYMHDLSREDEERLHADVIAKTLRTVEACMPRPRRTCPERAGCW